MPEIDPIRLSRLTTLQTGAAPERMIDAHDREELIASLREVWATGDAWFVLGGGSNLFAGDEPFEGTVVRILTSGIERMPASRPGFARLRVQAGHNWDDLVDYAVTEGLAGIEAMSGIPGTVGAAPVQNVGAYGQEIEQTLIEVELLDESTGDVSTVPASELGLGFRTSVLKHHHGSAPARAAVIVSVTLELEEVGSGAHPVRGGQLRQSLGVADGASVSLGWVRDRVRETRSAKGMVLDPDDPDTASAGSFFQNAVVSEAVARALPPECPRWQLKPDLDTVTVIPLETFDGFVPAPGATTSDVKVSSAWLIEHSGIGRSFKLPRSRAAISTKHALALTNRGGATAGEIAELARFIQGRVAAEFGIVLQPEPVLIDIDL